MGSVSKARQYNTESGWGESEEVGGQWEDTKKGIGNPG